MWYLDNDGSGTWNAGNRANMFGTGGWIPVAREMDITLSSYHFFYATSLLNTWGLFGFRLSGSGCTPHPSTDRIQL